MGLPALFPVYASPENSPSWLAAEKAKLDEAASLGAPHLVVTFSPYRLFWDSKGPESLDAEAAKHYSTLLERAESLGIEVIGAAPAWVLPPLADPPLTPASDVRLPDGVRDARLACVRLEEREEYERLANLRDRIWATLADEFPQVAAWFVGYEPGLEFYRCDGGQLALEELIEFAADTLKGVRDGVKSSNPEAQTIAHFAGRSAVALRVRGELVQPRTIAAGILSEVDRRGESASDFFDGWASDLYPALLDDRFPEMRQEFQSLAESGHLECAKTYCYQTSLWSESGWNVKCCELFEIDTSDLADDSQNYPEWEVLRTDTDRWFIPKIEVANDLAEVRLGEPEDEEQIDSVSAVKTTDGTDVVPDQEFDSEGSSPGDERNRWTALMDFFPVEVPAVAASHAPVFLRVNDRDWDHEDQTRFGTFVYRGPITFSPCTDDPGKGCGAMQLNGDDSANPDEGAQALLRFQLDEEPWDHPTQLFRVQIIEREVVNQTGTAWETWWRSEVWSGGNLIGFRDWFSAWDIENVLGIEIPERNDSKILFGLSQTAGPNWEGGIDADLVGTAYWTYDE